MFELMIIFAVLAGFWLLGSVLALAFKLVFGLIGGVFSLLGGAIGLLVGALALLVVLPLMAFALLPLLLPLLAVGVVVWALVRAARRPAPVQAHPHG
ncbi:hypothetical protein [Oleiagrimonas sp. C23AA]|uniref:hypothetical protein n=1 Tax=Oleiagrimonas sp. C23AA TaxID=2719047 RepID=UPI0014223611|nr:hypothetical protein [Oleiagrimonas sp. C23AA]NII09748.1 hypothetical protein [Oleiagrimonas sp. C23AA]